MPSPRGLRAAERLPLRLPATGTGHYLGLGLRRLMLIWALIAEQLFGHIKDEFFRGREFPDFETFKEELEAYIVHWNTRRRQVKLKGLTPEEFRCQSQAA